MSEALKLGDRALSMLDALASITAEPGRITRLYLTPEHRRAADLVTEWMRTTDLDVTEDALGTVRGARRARAGGSNKRLLIGSHIDTVINAGKYDGTLGVVAGILAIEEIERRGVKLPFGLEVVAFGDEEGVRFPSTLTSSAALAGTLDPAALDMVDPDGVTMRQALIAYGKDPALIGGAALDSQSLVGYVELHIEQGPVLEHHGNPLGVVTSIAGQSRFQVTVKGVAGHAGTVPMRLRRDAFAASAELAVAIERIALEFEASALVATIGTMTVKPGASNVIPDEVTFSLDVRAAQDPPRMEAIRLIKEAIEAIVIKRGVEIGLTPRLDRPTTPMAAHFRSYLAQAIDLVGAVPDVLPSGAGHDAMAMAAVTPAGMLFVRSKAGISHHPDEYSSVEDIGLAIEALIRFIIRLGEAGIE